MINFLSQLLKENIALEKLIMIPGPPKTADRIKELSIIENQYHNRKNPESTQQVLDMKMTKLFNSIIKRAGKACNKKEIKKLKNEIKPIIKLHKLYFNALRPSDLSKKIGQNIEFDNLKTAQSPSYPSGHTTQAFYLAGKLSKEYPNLENSFYKLANMIADSRVDRGVHFPSDNEAGKLLAKKLLDKG